jgi:hypothetical protein
MLTAVELSVLLSGCKFFSKQVAPVHPPDVSYYAQVRLSHETLSIHIHDSKFEKEIHFKKNMPTS